MISTLKLPAISNAVLAVICLVLGACGGSDAPTESASAYVFLSPSEVSAAPGQSIQLQVDIANLPTGDAASGYAISLSEDATGVRIESAACPPGTGTASCRLWTIRPDAGVLPGDYAFTVRASGTFTPASPADAQIRVVALATAKRAVIAASAQHLVTADGRLWARGDNAAGQTGVGFESVGFDVNAPFVLPDFIDSFVQVGTDTNWRSVVSAGNSAIALKENGTVWGWGANPQYEYTGASADPPGTYHQFVLPSQRNLQLRPRQIPGLARISAISAITIDDVARFLALADDGRLYGFGGGVDARYDMRVPMTLKFPSTDAPLVVPRVVQTDGTQTPLTGIVAIAGGVRNSGNGWAVALRDDGTVMQMGRLDSTFFRLDTGPEGVRAAPGMPFAVAGLPPVAIAVTVGRTFLGQLYSLAATQDGSVWSWTADDSVPRRVAGFSSPIVALDASGSDVAALDRMGGLWRWRFGATAPQRVSGVPAMGRLAHRAPNWSISADCNAGRGALWSAAGQRVGFFGEAAVNDGCASQDPVRLTLSKVGSGTISIDPVDGPLGLLCGVECTTSVSVPARRRDAFKVRATPAPGWSGPSFNPECLNGLPLLEVDTSCVATFSPHVLRGRLTVEADGPGRVTSTPAGIDCGADCTETYALGAVIQLTATPDPGYTLLRWSGPSNTNERDCRDGSVTMNVIGDDQDGFPLKKCIAVFAPLPRLTVAKQPGGSVTSSPAGIDCGMICSTPFSGATSISLSAVANAGFRFDGFDEVECRTAFVLTGDLHCTPRFTAIDAGVLTVNVIGNGRVTSVPAGIDCGNDCSETFAPGTEVTLTPLALANAAFRAWSGDPDCTDGRVRLDVARGCIATFVPSGWQPLGAPLSLVNSQRFAIAVDHSVASAPVTYAAIAAEAAGRVDLLVRRFDGSSWTLVGAGPINADVAVTNVLFTPAIAIDAGGGVTVAWSENERRVRVKRWDGSAWVSIGDNLNVDASQQAFGVQVATSSSQLVVAWLETVNNISGTGRMTVKRYSSALQPWTGGSVLPTETQVLALRLTTEANGAALLAFVPFDATSGTFEGPMRVLREGTFGSFADVCPALPRTASTSGEFYPNVELGFGVARAAFPREAPVVVFNNGEKVFALACRNAAWVGLDGSASGQVAAIGPVGESLHALAVAQGEGSGVALAWTKVTQITGGDREITTRVLVENSVGTAFVAGATPLSQVNSGFSRGLLSLTFLTGNSPLLAGYIFEDGLPASRVLRFLP